MVSKKKYFIGMFTLLLLSSLLLTGCPMPTERYDLTIQSKFEDNMFHPVHSLTTPMEGIHTYNDGDRVVISARDLNQPYEFSHWTVSTVHNDLVVTESFYERSIPINMNSDTKAVASFGCSDSSVCISDYECINNVCVLEDDQNYTSLMNQFVSLIESYGHSVQTSHDGGDYFDIYTYDDYFSALEPIANTGFNREQLISFLVSDFYHNSSNAVLVFHDADSLSGTVSQMIYVRERSVGFEFLNVAFWATHNNDFVYFGTHGIVPEFVTPSDLPSLNVQLVLQLEALTPGDRSFMLDFFEALDNYDGPNEADPIIIGESSAMLNNIFT